jgi:hypothetical protein
MTLYIISFHFLKLDSSIHHEIIITHQTTTITNENISIAVTKILLRDHMSIGNAFRAFTLVVLPAEGAESSLFISIQSQMNGTTVFNLIPQQFQPEELHIHFVRAKFGAVHGSQVLQARDAQD